MLAACFMVALAARLTADPTCANGVLDANHENCCAKSCEKCGGSDCRKRGKECCSGAIAKSSRSCEDFDAPCAMHMPHAQWNGSEIACALRAVAVDFAAELVEGSTSAVKDALRMHECPSAATRTVSHHIPTAGDGASTSTTAAVYIAPTGSDEDGDGSQAKPFRSPTKARDIMRAMPNRPATVILRGGTYYLGDAENGGTLVLDNEKDSGVTWQAFSGEVPILSGATPLDLQWQRWEGHAPIMVATLDTNLSFATLFAHAPPATTGSANSAFAPPVGPALRRLVRARVPNGNPESTSGQCFMGGVLPSEQCQAFFKRPQSTGKIFGTTVRTVNFSAPRGGLIPGDRYYPDYVMIEQRPPANLVADGFPNAKMAYPNNGGNLYNRSGGIKWSDFTTKNWTHQQGGEGAVVHLMNNGWGSVQYRLGANAVNHAAKEIRFERGGWQHGRGGGLGNWYVENVLEELDAPGEWYLDTPSRRLYLWPNATNTTSSSGLTGLTGLAAAVQRSVLVINGSMSSPVTDVTFAGVSFGHTAPTFLDVYERPPSGDWAIHRGGMVHVEGAERVVFKGGIFESAGGNAITFSRYSRDCSVLGTEIVRSGDSAVVAFGEIDYDTGDGTGGNYPAGLNIRGNHIHELGVYGKQTSCFFQGISGQNNFVGNVCYNGPRAMVNINDGFLGLTNISHNLLFNPCRESDDHGSFNSWDRTPIKFTLPSSGAAAAATAKGGAAVTTWTPGLTSITGNFVLNAYGGSHNIDHDDGSEYYDSSGNVLAFAQGCKGNFGAHRKCNDNLVLVPDVNMYSGKIKTGAVCAQQTNNGHGSTYADKHFRNNRCVYASSQASAYQFQGCVASKPETWMGNASACWDTGNNTFFLPKGGSVTVKCGKASLPLATWQGKGQEQGGKLEVTPPLDEVVKMAKEVLGIS